MGDDEDEDSDGGRVEVKFLERGGLLLGHSVVFDVIDGNTRELKMR